MNIYLRKAEQLVPLFWRKLAKSNRAIWQTLIVAAVLVGIIEFNFPDLLFRHFAFSGLVLLFAHTLAQLNGGYPKGATDYTYYSLGMIGVVLFFLADESNRKLNQLDAEIVQIRSQLDTANVRLAGLQDNLTDVQISRFFSSFKFSASTYARRFEAEYGPEIKLCEESARFAQSIPEQNDTLDQCLENLGIFTVRQLANASSPEQLRNLIKTDNLARIHVGRILDQQPNNPAFVVSSIILGVDTCGGSLQCIQEASDLVTSLDGELNEVVLQRNSHEIDNLSEFQVFIRSVRLTVWPYVLLTAFSLKIGAVSTSIWSTAKSRKSEEAKVLRTEPVTGEIYHSTFAGSAHHLRMLAFGGSFSGDQLEVACAEINSLLCQADESDSSMRREFLVTTALAIYEHHSAFLAQTYGDKDRNPERLRVRAQCYERAGIVFSECGNTKDAERCFLRSLKAWRNLETASGSVTTKNQMFIIDGLVTLYLETDQIEKAKSFIQKAKKLVKKFETEDRRNARQHVSKLSAKLRNT